MENLIAAVALLLTVPALASAQNADDPNHGQGYLFVAPIVTSYGPQRGGLNIGFGGELLVPQWLGVGAELAYANSTDGANMGMGSINFSYHFLKKGRVEPFATAGPSLYFGQRSIKSGFNLGGGVNYWAAKHLALRFEVRDNFGIGNEEFLGITHFVAFRFGMTFR